jgi:hypothetical protein
MVPWLGVYIFKERFFELTVDQVARFESIVVKETVANQEFMKQLEGKLTELMRSSGRGTS